MISKGAFITIVLQKRLLNISPNTIYLIKMLLYNTYLRKIAVVKVVDA